MGATMGFSSTALTDRTTARESPYRLEARHEDMHWEGWIFGR